MCLCNKLNESVQSAMANRQSFMDICMMKYAGNIIIDKQILRVLNIRIEIQRLDYIHIFFVYYRIFSYHYLIAKNV